MKERTVWIFVIFLLLAGFGIAIYLMKKEGAPQQAASNQNMPEVTAIEVKQSLTNMSQDWPATTFPFAIADIRPQIDGVIVERTFKEGSFVKKGQPLYVVDPAQRITIRSPISGYISNTNLTEGALITKNQSVVLATITQLNPIYVDIIIPSSKLHLVRNQKNIKVNVSVDGKEYEHAGFIKGVDVAANQTTDTVRLRAQFPNPDEKLLTGTFVNAKIHLPAQNLLLIPQRVVDYMPDGSMFVWVINKTDGSVNHQSIKVAESVGNKWIVTEGLSDGDVVVYEGSQKIAPGVKVKSQIVDPDADAKTN